MMTHVFFNDVQYVANEQLVAPDSKDGLSTINALDDSTSEFRSTVIYDTY